MPARLRVVGHRLAPRSYRDRAGTEIGRQREDPLSKVVTLRDRIITARAETLADAAVQLRQHVQG